MKSSVFDERLDEVLFKTRLDKLETKEERIAFCTEYLKKHGKTIAPVETIPKYEPYVHMVPPSQSISAPQVIPIYYKKEVLDPYLSNIDQYQHAAYLKSIEYDLCYEMLTSLLDKNLIKIYREYNYHRTSHIITVSMKVVK